MTINSALLNLPGKRKEKREWRVGRRGWGKEITAWEDNLSDSIFI